MDGDSSTFFPSQRYAREMNDHQFPRPFSALFFFSSLLRSTLLLDPPPAWSSHQERFILSPNAKNREGWLEHDEFLQPLLDVSLLHRQIGIELL